MAIILDTARILLYAFVVLPALPAAGALAQEQVEQEEQEETDIELGREVFTSIAQPSCTICHTLADAEAEGRIGPNLDDLQPTEEQVAKVVREGADGMPSYRDRLSDEEIEAVAGYVSEVAGEEPQMQ